MARILLIDDELGMLLVLSQALTDAAHQVKSVSDGRSVTEGLMSLDFDLVVTDINMPGADGVEVLTYLRENHPHMGVIAMSGGGRLPARFLLNLTSRLGAVRTLQKPFPLQQLVDAVEQILDRGQREHGSDLCLAAAAQA